MNDDFLHRLRKAPSPEFLAELKARLDLQAAAGRPRRFSLSRRWSFSRGLLVGLLLGGTAFAVTSLSIIGVPTSLHAFLTAPAELLVRISGRSSRSEDRQQQRPTPLGPSWLPNHVVPQSPSEAANTGPAPSDATAAPSPTPAEARSPAATQSVIPSPWNGIITVVASPGTYPHAMAVANRSSQMKVSLDMNGTAFERLCGADAKNNPSIAELSHRVVSAEIRNCALNLADGIIELKIGHQAIVLARGRLYGPLRLSARDLFLALARQIPVPTDSAVLIDNPNTTWNQVDGALPYDRIQVLGPALGTVPGKLVAALLLEAGCNTYPWLAALRTTDPPRYEEICTTLRNDGAYKESSESGWAYSENLVRDPTVLGIFTLQEFEMSKDKLSINAIDGVEPSPETVVADTYPASRTLYLYLNKRVASENFWFSRLIGAYLAPMYLYGYDPGGWAFVALNAAERADIQQTLKGLRF